MTDTRKFTVEIIIETEPFWKGVSIPFDENETMARRVYAALSNDPMLDVSLHSEVRTKVVLA